MTSQLRDGVKEKWLSGGSFPPTVSHRTPLHDRILGERFSRKPSLDEFCFETIPQGALEFFVQDQLFLRDKSVVPAEYSVFEVVGASSTLFNFNLDGLASAYCSRLHKVLEPHGRVDELWFSGDQYKFWSEAVTELDFVLPHSTPKILPSPEPVDIGQRPEYVTAQKYFRNCPAMVIVGYAFAKFKNRMDDSASWNFVVNLLRANPCPVFIISPFPEELVDLLNESIGARRAIGIPAYWETLSATLLCATGQSRELNPSWTTRDLSGIMYEYQFALGQRKT